MANRFISSHAPRARSVQNAARRMRLALPVDRSSRTRFRKIVMKPTPRLSPEPSDT